MNPQSPTTPPSSDALFKRMVVILTASSLAIIYGWLAGFVRQPDGSLSFLWRWQILLWTLIGFASTAYFWRKIWPSQDRPNATRKGVVSGFFVLLLPGLWWLIFPLRSLSGEHLWDVIKGLTAAAIVLSLGAWMIIRLGRAFEGNDATDEKDSKK